MAVILWVLGLSLLLQGCLCSIGQTDSGCSQWKYKENSDTTVCCEACHPGNRLVERCGLNPKLLCKPCEPETFTEKRTERRCARCTQCVGAQVLVKKCTASSDTQCGCKDGYTCGDARCSFCVLTCGKGHEPTENRTCVKCPNGTFNDQIHQKCKPWSTKCPNPGQEIKAKGDAFNDIKCTDVINVHPVTKPDSPDHTAWPGAISVFSVVPMVLGLIVIFILAMTLYQKRKKTTKTITKTPIIRTPTDEPATLIAIECSFHEAQQEQGSSSESLASKDSSEQLLS
ncbi:tumor necrosis factor receptor superfamily member 9-like [Symphorus nematophorus]